MIKLVYVVPIRYISFIVDDIGIGPFEEFLPSQPVERYDDNVLCFGSLSPAGEMRKYEYQDGGYFHIKRFVIPPTNTIPPDFA